jgi:hypothetical protein
MSRNIMTAAQLSEVASSLQAGESVTYYTGHLSEACRRNQALCQLRDIAQRLSTMRMASPSGALHFGMGMLHLSQRRVAAGFDYIATKR